MKQIKPIFNIIIFFLFIAQNSFALSKPIPGVGIVVKKNPGSGSITVATGTGGGFSIKLEEGEYVLLFPQDQLQTSINGIVKTTYPKSNYQYNGSGVEMLLDNSRIIVNVKALQGNKFAIDKQNSFTITVPQGGATLSGMLSWNDAVMTDIKTCPDGFTMQNGECVLNNNSGNQQSRTEGKTKGKVTDLGPKSPMLTAGNSNNSPSLNISLNANGGTSSSNGVSNSFSFNPNLGIELQWNHFGIGLDAGTFNSKPNFDYDTYAAPLQNLDFLTLTNTKNNYTSTYLMLGPQYTVSLGGRHTPFHNKLTFTIALKGGYTFNKTPEFSITDTSTPPKTVASYEVPQNYKQNVFSLKPSISFAYWINESIAITANAQYLMQTSQEESTIRYRDLSAVKFNLNPQEVKSQIFAAPQVTTSTNGPDKYLSFGFGITYSINKRGKLCQDGSCITSDEAQKKAIKENGLKKNDVETTNDETQRKGVHATGLEEEIRENDIKKIDVEAANDETQRKGVHATGLEEEIRENDIKKIDVETTNDETQRKGVHATGLEDKIRENDIKKIDVETTNDETQRKGITEGGLPKNETEYVLTDAEVKAIAETLVTMRKGWDGSIKGNIAEKGINENGLKKNEAKSENTNLKITSIAQTLVNLARKGWDGSIKGNKIESEANEADVKAMTETLVNIRKGWDGSIKGNKVKNIDNQADVKTIAETLVNLRKGWDGSIKGNKTIKTNSDASDKNPTNKKGWDGSIKGNKSRSKQKPDKMNQKGIKEQGLK